MSIFIVIEGIDCAGKTTQVQKLGAALKEKGKSVCMAREPGSSEIGERIRVILKDPAYSGRMDPLTSLFLFNAARRQFIKEVVAPALERGEIVLSDRFLLSTIAYQGYAEGLDIDFVRGLCAQTVQGCMPHKTFLLDIGMQEMKKRLIARGDAEKERYESVAMSFHEKIRQGYCAELARDPSRIERIDGERDVEIIAAEIVQKVLLLIE